MSAEPGEKQTESIGINNLEDRQVLAVRSTSNKCNLNKRMNSNDCWVPDRPKLAYPGSLLKQVCPSIRAIIEVRPENSGGLFCIRNDSIYGVFLCETTRKCCMLCRIDYFILVFVKCDYHDEKLSFLAMFITSFRASNQPHPLCG